MFELLDKDFKADIITMFNEMKENMLVANEERNSQLKNRNFKKKHQMEIFNWKKIAICEIIQCMGLLAEQR